MRSSDGSPPFSPDIPYAECFRGLPAFKTLRDAEGTLLRLESLRREFSQRGDRKGLAYCRQVGLIGRRRAEGIAVSPRVAAWKRASKREIATWFAIWLETPDLFEQWLDLRKQTSEYEELVRREAESV